MSSEVKTLFREEGENHTDISQAVNDLKNKDASMYDSTCAEIEGIINPAIKSLWLKSVSKNRQGWLFTDNVHEPNQYASAEIESIVKIQQEVGQKIQVYLIATDTVLSRLASEIIASSLKQYFSPNIEVYFNPEIDVINNLRIDDFDRFRQGLVKLSDRFYQIAGNKLAANQSEDIILNITGGYKGIVPFLSLLGQINQTSIQYIFEDTGVLINIPQLPIKLDTSLFDKHWEKLLQLEGNIFNRYQKSELYEDLAPCFDLDDNDFCFNFLGEALWKKYKSQYFIFYAPDDTWSEIQKQRDIKRILATKLWKKEVQEGSKNEQKGDKWCYDDGNNNNRIYYLKKSDELVIYKTFENEEAAKKYIDSNVNFEQVVNLAKQRKIKKH